MRVRRGRQENTGSQQFTKTFTGSVYGDPDAGEAAISVASVLFHPRARAGRSDHWGE
jgi:hypothetical protein